MTKIFHPSFGRLVLIFAVVCLPLILSRRATNYSNDESSWHLPAVRQIRSHWPKLDLKQDSLSAVSPGYHYVLATVAIVTGTHRVPLRLFTWGLSVGVLFILWRTCASSGAGFASAVILPLALSNFFVKSASWIVTDNTAILGATAVLGLTLTSSGRRSIWLSGWAAAAATFMRQLYVWTAVPVALAAIREHRRDRGGWATLVMPAALPLIVLLILVSQWGGLVPPVWRSVDQGSLSAAPLVYVLAVYALLGAVYAFTFRTGSWREDFINRWTVLGFAAGLGVALCTASTYSMPEGRWGGYLWSAAARLPSLNERSVVFLILTPMGAMLLVAMLLQLVRVRGRGYAALWLTCYLSWALTFLPNRLVFHRYYEPMTLVFLILWAVSMGSGGKTKFQALHVLSLVQLSLTLATAHFENFGPA